MRSERSRTNLRAAAARVRRSDDRARPGTHAVPRKTIAEIEDGLADLMAQRTRRRQYRAEGQRENGRTPSSLSQRSQARSAAGRPGPETPATQKKLADSKRARKARARGHGARATPPTSLEGRRARDGDPFVAGQVVAVPATRHPLRAARRRQDDGRAARARGRQDAAVTRRFRPTRRSSRRAARRCAGTRARRRIPCWGASTIRSIRAAGATSPRAASPSPSSAW